MCQNFKCVTIFFGNIVGFDSLAADCNPDEVDTDETNDYDESSLMTVMAKMVVV